MIKGRIIRITGQDDPAELGIDEIVAESVDLHLERMNDGQLWIGVYYGDKRRLSIQLHAVKKDRLEVLVEDEDC